MNDRLLQSIGVPDSLEQFFSPRFPRRGVVHAGYNPGRLYFGTQVYRHNLCRRKDVEACLLLALVS